MCFQHKPHMHGKRNKKNKQEDGYNSTQQGHEWSQKGVYKSFKIPGLPKIDIDCYIDQAR